MLVRGLGGYRTSSRIARHRRLGIASAAAGEVWLTGVVEAAELLLMSPLQSEPCVYYRRRVEEDAGADLAQRLQRGACGRLPRP